MKKYGAPYEIPHNYAKIASQLDATTNAVRDLIFRISALVSEPLTRNERAFVAETFRQLRTAEDALEAALSKYSKGFLVTYAYEGKEETINEQGRENSASSGH